MKKHLLLFKTLIIACLAMVAGGGISVAQTGTYEKVTDDSSLEAGASVIIVNESKSVALSKTQNSNNRGQASITINNGVITPSSEVAILTLGVDAQNGWSFYDADKNGYLYAASSSSNHLKTQTNNDDNGLAVINISPSGDATIKFKGKNTRNLLRYNSSSKIFSCYSSGQDPVQIYKLQSNPKTSTTTTFGENYDNKTFKVLVGQENSFTAPTATFSPNNATGTLTYSSDNTTAIDVNSETGELTFKAIGKATITATFSGDENYYASSASYTVDYTDGRIVISNDNSSFRDVESYKTSYDNYTFYANDGKTYTFKCIQIRKGDGDNLQMKASSGVAESPSFDFKFGYKVNVTYYISNNSTPLTITSESSLSASGVSTGESGTSIAGTGYMATLENIPANSSFTIKAGGKTTYVSKIEIISYTSKQKTATKVSFPAGSYEVIQDEESSFTAPTATLTDASGNAIEGASLVYSISENPFATINSETGVVSFITNPELGSATVTASYAGDNTYNEASASYTINYIANPYTEYTSFKDIKTNAASGAEVRITLNNAKVVYAYTHPNSQIVEAYVRNSDAKGDAICFYNTGLDIKQNDILNGTLKATYTIFNGLPELTSCTNTEAIDVTSSEDAALPKEITLNDLTDNSCDLITVKGVLMDGSDNTPQVYNKFYIDYDAIFNSATIDLTGIIIPYEKGATTIATSFEIAPTNKYDIVYQFSENDETTHVGAVTDAKVAIKRTLSNKYWNTLCLPFSLDENQITATFDGGTITEFSNVNAEGTVMTFKEATSIEAGKPYLFKPAKTVENPVFEGVTITSADAGSVTVTNTNGNYAFVGTYSKKDMATDQSEVFITTSGKLSYPAAGTNTIKGMRAFIQLPKTANAKAFNLNIGGEATSIDTIDGGLFNGNATIYNLNGQKMSSDISGLAKGLYIVNGKKMIVK